MMTTREVLVDDAYRPNVPVLAECVPISEARVVRLTKGEPYLVVTRVRERWRCARGADAVEVPPAWLGDAVSELLGVGIGARRRIQIPKTSVEVPLAVGSAALEVARRAGSARGEGLTKGDVWLLVAATRASRFSELARCFDVTERTIQTRSASIHAKSGQHLRDLVHEVFWRTTGDFVGGDEPSGVYRALEALREGVESGAR